MRNVLFALLVLSVSNAAIQAKSPQQIAGASASNTSENQHRPPIQTNVRQVLVPVVVIDKNGHYVPDLKASDFQLFEDTTPETIVAFSANNSGTPPDAMQPTTGRPALTSAASSQPLTDNSKRTYLVLIDTLHSSFANFVDVRKALEKFFEQEHSSDSRYGLIALGRQNQVVQDFTPDPGSVLSALRSRQLQKSILQSESSNLGFETGRFTELVTSYCKSCDCVTVPQEPEQVPLCAARTAEVRAFLTRTGERAFVLDENFLQQLKAIVETVSSMPKARTIIFISDGFNRSSGQEFYSIFQGFIPKTRANFSLNPRDTQSELEAILRIAVRCDVKFYTLDSRGLYTTASFAGSSLDVSHWGATPASVDQQTVAVARQNTDALAELAQKTGGLFFENNNDLLKGIRTAFADGRQYYTLAYVPTDKMFNGEYRTIHVALKRKGLVVHAKPGYWATN